MGQLDGRVAIITGAASGIGAACARLLAGAGAKLVLTDVEQTGGERVASEVDGVFVRHDVTSEAGWPAVAAMAGQRFGGLHILVANAGIAIMGPVTEMPYAVWRRQMAVNVDGMFLAVKHCLPLMRQCGDGSIIMMSSVAGLRRCGRTRRLQRHERRGAVVRQVSGAGMRAGRGQHPGQLGASRCHQLAKLEPGRTRCHDGARREGGRRNAGAAR